MKRYTISGLKLAVIALMLISISACSVKKPVINNNVAASGITIKITGTSAKINRARVSIIAVDNYNRETFWTDTIKSDRFGATVHVPRPGFYQIQFAGDYPPDSLAQGWLHWINLYLEDNCSYTISAGTDWSILHNHSKVYSTSLVQKKLSLFDESFTDELDFKNTAIARKSIAADLLEKAHHDTEYKQLSASIENDEEELKLFYSTFTMEFALKNPGSIVSVHKLLDVNDMKKNHQAYLEIYDHLDEALKRKFETVNFKSKLDAAIK